MLDETRNAISGSSNTCRRYRAYSAASTKPAPRPEISHQRRRQPRRPRPSAASAVHMRPLPRKLNSYASLIC